MKAKRIDGQAVNGKRSILAEVLPLATPYAVTFFPIYACNFKCNYCIHSLEEKNRPLITDCIFMDFELYKKCINDMKKFPKKLKVLHFIGYGEPLLHKNIDEMIAYAVKENVAESVDIVTNGALLSRSLSQKLVEAGLSTLRISIQGTTAKNYKERSNVDINFDDFRENLQYFYENRKNTRVHIKIIDVGLDVSEKQTFLQLFGDICDTIAIEHLSPNANEIDYNNVKMNDESLAAADFSINTYGNKVVDTLICPQPFYSMQINPDGRCVPCCSSDIPLFIGDAKEESIVKIWSGLKFNEFRKMQLKKQKNINSACATCSLYKYSMFEEEILDLDAEKLCRFFE